LKISKIHGNKRGDKMNTYLVFKNGIAICRVCATNPYEALTIIKQIKGKGRYTLKENY